MYSEEYRLFFGEISAGSPEEYSVYNGNSKGMDFVGIVSLDWGELTCIYIDTRHDNKKEEIIHVFDLEDKHMRGFDNEEQRLYYMDLAAKKFYEKIKNEENCANNKDKIKKKT